MDRKVFLSLLAYYYNFYCAFGLHGSYHLVHHFWSLCVEEHFYLIWPFCAYYLSTKNLVRVCLVGAVSSLLLRIYFEAGGANHLAARVITPCSLDALLAGSLVAIGFRQPNFRPFLSRFAPYSAAASAALLLALFLQQGGFGDHSEPKILGGEPVFSFVLTFGVSALALLFASIVAMLVEERTDTPWSRALSWTPLTNVGKYSYGMYVLHPYILRVLIALAPKALTSAPGWLGKPVMALVAIPLSYCVGAASYVLFEKRFLALKKFFPYPRLSDDSVADLGQTATGSQPSKIA